MPPSRAARHIVLFALIELLLACYFLDNSGGANAISRAAPAVMWVHQGSWCIDPLAHFTLDTCVIEGHAYSEKAPLASWLIVPFVWLGKTLGWAFAKPNLHAVLQAITVGNVLTGSVPFAVLVALFVQRARRLAGPHDPVFLAHALLYGTFVWAYAGAYFGHMLAACLLLGASVALRAERGVMAGLLLGCSFLGEYPTGIALVIWGAQYLVRRRFGIVAQLFLGFVPALLLITIYNTSITGSPWTMTYKYVAAPQFSAMRQMYGFGLPSLQAVYGLTVGMQRGLLWFAPVLLVPLFVGVRTHVRRACHVIVGHPEVSVACALFVLNSSYYVWWGGASFGPRHLCVAAVLLAYAALDVLQREEFSKRALLGLALFSHGMVWMDKATITHHIGPETTALAALWPDVSMQHFSVSDAVVWAWPVCFVAGSWLARRCNKAF